MTNKSASETIFLCDGDRKLRRVLGAIGMGLALSGCVSFEPPKLDSEYVTDHKFGRPATVRIEEPKHPRGTTSGGFGTVDAPNFAARQAERFTDEIAKAYRLLGYEVTNDEAANYRVSVFWKYRWSKYASPKISTLKMSVYMYSNNEQRYVWTSKGTFKFDDKMPEYVISDVIGALMQSFPAPANAP